MTGAEKRLASLAASTFAVIGRAFLICPTLRSRQGVFVVGGTLAEIIELASGDEPCSQWMHGRLRDELLDAASICLERQGGSALLMPLIARGPECYLAAGDLDQIRAIAASELTNPGK
jgi:hypothetical protein